ncbi:hypothetical protein QBC46DRAFT_418174 [Diplogelasinospora grovesii]|uniref:SNF2 N-terminal domain-containing protein n=1 Tax=Diplogelasinospora grovesii TaxID=303347 RepID=A0AAN6N1S3_9PEZI|nr:hypothetical protein QBC46DRAFT_418174 [Diplogelasinospora grovesii]
MTTRKRPRSTGTRAFAFPRATTLFTYVPISSPTLPTSSSAPSAPCLASCLSNEVGMGKTSTIMATFFMTHLHWVREKAAGRPVRAGPVLVFEPANLVTQVFNELAAFWGGILKPHVFYGSKKAHVNNPAMCEATIRKKEFYELLDTLAEASNDPQGSSRLYIHEKVWCFAPV